MAPVNITNWHHAEVEVDSILIRESIAPSQNKLHGTERTIQRDYLSQFFIQRHLQLIEIFSE